MDLESMDKRVMAMETSIEALAQSLASEIKRLDDGANAWRITDIHATAMTRAEIFRAERVSTESDEKIIAAIEAVDMRLEKLELAHASKRG